MVGFPLSTYCLTKQKQCNHTSQTLCYCEVGKAIAHAFQAYAHMHDIMIYMTCAIELMQCTNTSTATHQYRCWW